MAENTSLQTTQQTTNNSIVGIGMIVAGVGIALLSLGTLLFDQPRHTTTTPTRFYRR